jgi:hypothetical protein
MISLEIGASFERGFNKKMYNPGNAIGAVDPQDG